MVCLHKERKYTEKDSSLATRRDEPRGYSQDLQEGKAWLWRDQATFPKLR